MLANEGVLQDVNHFTNIRGPQKCPKRCSECPHGDHHWLTVTFPGCLDEECDDWKESLNHPAVQEWLTIRHANGQIAVNGGYEDGDGHLTYLKCKHCEAWHELTEAMMDDPDFDIV